MWNFTKRVLFGCIAFWMALCAAESVAILPAQAQTGEGTLEGVVVDASGPLLGATVIVKNTTRGTTTDAGGVVCGDGRKRGEAPQGSGVGCDR